MSEVAIKFDLEKVRKDFPVLSRKINGQELVYLDNGATAQKPQAVIDRLVNYYSSENSNIHRGVHTLSQEATTAYEEVREKMRDFIHAAHKEEIIFTKGTTDSINLVASSYGRHHLKAGDEVVITTMEHHSNIVPWQMICEEKGAKLKVAPISDQGELLLDDLENLLSEKTKILALVHISNTLGSINPVKKIIEMAHAKNIPVLIDGAQQVAHAAPDMQDLDVDFYAFGLHKMFGPTGIGVLYGKKELLESLPPYQGGGDMIKTVTFEKTTYNELPHKFEAGTPNIAAGIATGATLDYLNKLDWEAIAKHEEDLLLYGSRQLQTIDGIKFVGEAKNKASVISFNVEGVHAYDLGVIIDKMGIAVRTGHHCTQPLMNRFGILGTVRASFAFYNTREEIDQLTYGLKRAVKMLRS